MVGAYGSNSNTGAAYVFTRSGTTWSQQAELTAADGAANDNFGGSVAISGSTAVVGAPANGAGTGAAYVYVALGHHLVPAGRAGPRRRHPRGLLRRLGGHLRVHRGGRRRATNSGRAAYVFTRSGTTWSQQAKLTAAGAAAGDDFGSSVAIAGSTAVVGAEGSNSGTGAAYVFTRSGSTWSQQAELTAADGAAGDISASQWPSPAPPRWWAPRHQLRHRGGLRVHPLRHHLVPAGRADRRRRRRWRRLRLSVAISGSTALAGAVGKLVRGGGVCVQERITAPNPRPNRTPMGTSSRRSLAKPTPAAHRVVGRLSMRAPRGGRR